MSDDDFQEIDLPEPPAAEPGADGTFDQAGIDALFGDPESVETRKRGLRAVLEARNIRNERLPMLEVVCERMMRSFTTSMRNLTSDTIEATLKGITSARFGDFMSHVGLPAMLAVFKMPTWKNYGLVIVESNLIFAIVDALLGGRQGGQPYRIDGRPFTSIETQLVSKMIELVLREFSAAFTQLEPVEMHLERIETSPRFAGIAGPSNIASVATFRIDMEGRGGEFSLVLPAATLEPVREKLIQRFMGEKLGGDTMWQDHLEDEIRKTSVDIDVVLGETVMRVGEVRNLEVGQTIALNRTPEDPLELRCGGITMGHAQIGQRRNHIAVNMVTEIAKGVPQ